MPQKRHSVDQIISKLRRADEPGVLMLAWGRCTLNSCWLSSLRDVAIVLF
jgi:hypothetical protein